MTTLESRSTVNLVLPDSRPRFPGPLRGVTAHWNGPAMGLSGRPHSACRAAWRGIQYFHMVTRGWADVAYSAAVCHHNIVMEGRGPGVRTAANGTNSGNNSWYAVFFMVGEGEEPSSAMLTAAEWYARVHLGTRNWNRHSDHKATTCAGTVNKYISGGNISTSGVERGYITVGDRGQAVKNWQQDLLKWDSLALPRFGADGDFGDETDFWTLKFQKSVGLKVDGLVGPATLAAMEERLLPSRPKPEEKPEPKPEPGPFPDVAADHPHVAGIEKLKELNIFNGYDDGTFRPNQPLTRAAAATVLARMYEELSK